MNRIKFYTFTFCVASLLALPASNRAAELLLDGTFVTTMALPASSSTGNVGRIGNTSAGYFLTGTTTNGLGWQTDASNGLFEIWTAGFKSTPAGIGNVLELSDSTSGTNSYQVVNSTAGGGTRGTVSFGYAARDAGTDAFTVSVTDLTAGTTAFSTPLNPTNALTSPITFTQAFTIVPGDQYKLNFLDQNTNGATAGLSAHIDQVSFQQAPEPSTVTTMLGVGAGLLVFARRRVARAAR